MNQLSSPSPSSKKQQLTEVLLEIVAVRGLDQVSVREVATAAGVSIGTVQHYFPTKDDMLAAAFGEVVNRVRDRLLAVPVGPDTRNNLDALLKTLLPIGRVRLREVRIETEFAAKAITSRSLAAIQKKVLDELRQALAAAFVRIGEPETTKSQARLAAQVAIATVDGLSLHAVSTSGWLGPVQMKAAVDLLLDSLVEQLS